MFVANGSPRAKLVLRFDRVVGNDKSAVVADVSLRILVDDRNAVDVLRLPRDEGHRDAVSVLEGHMSAEVDQPFVLLFAHVFVVGLPGIGDAFPPPLGTHLMPACMPPTPRPSTTPW